MRFILFNKKDYFYYIDFFLVFIDPPSDFHRPTRKSESGQ